MRDAQIETLGQAEVDMVSAMTFNNIPEAVGVARAAAGAGLPLSISLMADATGRLTSGPSPKEAVETVDEQAGDARPAYCGINCSHPVEFEPALLPGPWLTLGRLLRHVGRSPGRYRPQPRPARGRRIAGGPQEWFGLLVSGISIVRRSPSPRYHRVPRRRISSIAQ